jgi:hypothetical protein
MHVGYKPFQIDIEAELFEKTNTRGESETWIGGLCTTDHMDREGERILQDGLDFKPFMDHGFFNDNHDKATGGAVGVPTKAELRTLSSGHKGWWVEGKLFDSPRAREIKDLASELKRSGDVRKLGFSVEGRILERDDQDPSTVRRAVVREVAVTRCPVNPYTTLDTLAKSLSVGSSAPAANTPTTGEGAGAILAPEALEGVSSSRPRVKRKKRLRRSEAVQLIRSINPRLAPHAGRIVDYTIRHFAGGI